MELESAFDGRTPQLTDSRPSARPAPDFGADIAKKALPTQWHIPVWRAFSTPQVFPRPCQAAAMNMAGSACAWPVISVQPV